MFTGIIEEIGIVEKITPISGGITLKIKADKILDGIAVNDSVCIDGVCLTVIKFDKNSFWADAVGATLEKTTFNKVKAGTLVNLERSVKLSDRLGGHLAGIPFAPGRLVWSRPGVRAEIVEPVRVTPSPGAFPVSWLVGEALTNLYVGLCRYRRGEKLSAARFVQWYAVDRVVELAERIEAEQPAYRDIFTAERRFEQRFPGLAAELPRFVQGYDRTPESARAILEFLEAHFEVNPAMKQVILELCEP